MFQFFTENGQVRNGHAYITGSDVNHIRNVLRLKEGDPLQVIQEDDPHLYLCRILQTGEDCVDCIVEEKRESETELPVKVILFQGLPKGDKMEWILQKCVELGVHEIVPVSTKNTVVKLDAKKAAGKVNRWNAIAQAAAKQAKRGIVPKVHPPVSFVEAVSMMRETDVALIAYEHADMDQMAE
ncbi:MAG: RsmE family RNA methyltransferase, partial [Lachnospiraceae bacterium]|nr:RsmE family RNA methyltransferase [Lachnospiraceae bacterium]